MNHRIAAILLAVCALLTGCASVVPEAEDERQVYASYYPIYALSGLVLGEVPGIRLACIAQPQDECLRSYELSDWDLYRLAYAADAVILGGRGLEEFESMMYSLGDTGPALITAQYGLSLYNEEDTAQLTEDSSHLEGPNPHLYLSVSGAMQIAKNIEESMAELYPDRSDQIRAGGARSQETLGRLLSEVQEICAGARGKKVILLNEALIYPALEYGLEVAYWYDRESATTLQGDGLAELIGELGETGADVILIEKQAPAELTRALEGAGYRVARIDILSGYALDAGYDGYIAAQQANARAIAAAYSMEGD